MRIILLIFVFVQTACGALLSNEARVVRDILKDYNPDVKPTIDSDKLTTVNVSFSLGSLDDVNEKDQILSTFGWMYMTWFDELLRWDPKAYGGVTSVRLRQSKIWLPEVAMLNSVDMADDLSFMSKFRVMILYNGKVIWIPGFKWQTSCTFDLTYFPYDHHECEVVFVNWIYGGDLLVFQNTSSTVMTHSLVPNAGWNVTNTKVITKLRVVNSLKIPEIIFTLSLERIPTYFVWNVLIPCILMTLASLLVFALPSESGEKIGLSITVLLGYSVILLMVSDITPQSGNTIPLLSQYIVVSMVLTGCCLALTVLVLHLHHQSPSTPVPSWVQRVILKGIGTILCVRTVEVEVKADIVAQPQNDCDDILIVDLERKINECMNTQQKTNNNSDSSQLQLPDFVVAYLMKKADEDVVSTREQQNQRQWQQLARVVDRFFLLIVTAVIMSLMLAFLLRIMK